MKIEFKTALAFLAIATMTVGGCNPYDDSVLSGRVDDLENRVKTLEERIEEFQTCVDDFTVLINQYKAETRIESFTEVADGYLITFADNKGTMHIKHGGIPELSVVFDNELQEYVWTANGNVITDKEGKPVPAYIAPQFEVRDGKLGYTLANEWHEVFNGESVGLIKDVVETSDGVNFVLGSGSIITIPKVGFRLNIDFFEYGAPAGKTVNIPYSITDGDQNAELLVYPDEGFTVENTGYELNITLPSEEEKAYGGKVLVVAVNGNGATSAKVIRFGTLITDITSAEIVNLSRKGGLATINIKSNRPYAANLQGDPDNYGLPPTWLREIESPATRAAREDVITYEVEPMSEDMHKDRQATLLVEWNTNITEEMEDYENYENYIIRKEIIIMQLDTKDVEVDKPMDNDGNIYESSYIDGERTGKLPGGWTFTNCSAVNYLDAIPENEVRFVLNGLNTKKGILTSPAFENGIGSLFINHVGLTNNANQEIRFKVEWFKSSDNSLISSKEFSYAMNNTEQHSESIDINCSESCYIVITNTSTKGKVKTKFLNAVVFLSMYYSDCKAE